MFGWVRSMFGGAGRSSAMPANWAKLRARYDAAQTTDENRRHWANADGLSARSANSPHVRRTLRMRARYEVANNSWASGIVRTVAHHTIGSGPRLQLLTTNAEANDRVERAFHRWARAVGLHEKLIVAKQTQVRDGEWFALLTRDPSQYPIQLALRPLEADQVASPYSSPTDNTVVDGIRVREAGEPVEFYIRDHHPGDTGFAPTLAGDWYPARHVLHYFRQDRPGQVRGVPDITPALPLFALLRRFTLATCSAAEQAANMALFLSSTTSAVSPAEIEDGDFAAVEIVRNMLNVMPEGWRPEHLKPEHPSTTYEMFQKALLNEIARCLSMPYNIAACNSAGYNYSSGRLDHQTYYRSIEIDQALIEARILNQLVREWLLEAVFVPGLLDGLPPIHQIEFTWQWDAEPVIDEQAAAASAAERLQSGQTTLEYEYARNGLDIAKETARAAAFFGVSVEEYKARLLGVILPPAATAPIQAASADPATTGGEFGAVSRRQWKNNRKAIRDVLGDLIAGSSSETMAREELRALGLSEERANALIQDAIDGTVDDPQLQETAS